MSALAIADAMWVFPVPGGPKRMTFRAIDPRVSSGVGPRSGRRRCSTASRMRPETDERSALHAGVGQTGIGGGAGVDGGTSLVLPGDPGTARTIVFESWNCWIAQPASSRSRRARPLSVTSQTARLSFLSSPFFLS